MILAIIQSVQHHTVYELQEVVIAWSEALSCHSEGPKKPRKTCQSRWSLGKYFKMGPSKHNVGLLLP